MEVPHSLEYQGSDDAEDIGHAYCDSMVDEAGGNKVTKDEEKVNKEG